MARYKYEIISQYGFGKPRDFSKVIPLLASIILLASIAVSACALHFLGALDPGSPRMIYFVYISTAALLAAITSFSPRLAWILILLCTIDFVFGVGSSLLTKMNFTKPWTSLLPTNGTQWYAQGFQYHPLLQGVPAPNYVSSRPFYIRHDKYGLRGSNRDPVQLRETKVVATFGGSTTYDIGVANGQTWSDELEKKLGGEFSVLNHGVPGYSTVENLLQTAFYNEGYGIRPRCAVYFLGWNDIRNAHIPNLDRAYANFHLLSQLDNLGVRNASSVARTSPLGRIMVAIFNRYLGTETIPYDYRNEQPQLGDDQRLEDIFVRNLRMIAALNRGHQITTIFAGNVLRVSRFDGESRNQWTPLLADKDVVRLQMRFNELLKNTSDRLGVQRILIPFDEFQESDFVDSGHFSPVGSRKFASKIAPIISEACK